MPKMFVCYTYYPQDILYLDSVCTLPYLANGLGRYMSG